MTFARGATLPTQITLGQSDAAHLGPTAGNGFYKRWPDDLAQLAEVGITDLRLSVDWARLQQRPGQFNGDWAEFYDGVIDAANGIEQRVWLTLFDGGVPRWFDNEGGLDDAETIATWWPRWVERVAERFGDRIHAWVPFVEIPTSLPTSAWNDTWGILGGGDQPVVASTPDSRVAELVRYADASDLAGMTFDFADGPATNDSGADPAADSGIDPDVRSGIDPDNRSGIDPDDSDVDPVDSHNDSRGGRSVGGADARPGDAERVEIAFHEASERLDGTPLVVTAFTPGTTDADRNAERTVEFVSRVDRAIDSGIDIRGVFIDPAIAGPDSAGGLIGSDRVPSAVCDVFAEQA